MSSIKKIIKEWLLPPAVLRTGLSFCNSNQPNKLSESQKILLDKNRGIENRHSGERCFIIGGGSSITNQDLTKLSDECVLGVSNTFVHSDYPFFEPKYHILPSIFASHGHLYTQENIIAWLREMEEKTLAAEMFFHIGDKAMIDKYRLFKNRVIHWDEYVPWDRTCDFSLDLAHIPSVWSVSEVAITVALYLGFEKIYLLGFDHDWFNGPLVYFYDHTTEHKLQPTAEKLSFADAEFQMRRHADIFKKYKCLYQIKNNIYNANADTNHYMDVFPKVDYDSLFR